ncbi:MAG TPA: fasciclin domain-containing protein [Polaromonas sp.]
MALSKAGNYVIVEQALVQQADISATNGVVHTVDGVLIPPATH